MNEDTAIAILPLPEVPAPPAELAPMTVLQPQPVGRTSRNALFRKPIRHSPVRRRPPPRNARRNASSSPAAKVGKGGASKDEPQKSGVQRMGALSYSLFAAGVASVGGALAARWSVHPFIVSTVLTAAGALGGYKSKTDLGRQLWTGVASTGVSQFALMGLAKASEPPKLAAAPTLPAPVVAALPAPAPRRQSADLGTLPPGFLDAAFERARAELAVQADSHSHSSESPHHYDHVPFAP